jgi:hypothetical protein
MISAISNAGMLRFQLVVGSFSGQVLIDFLGRLLRDGGGRKVHLIRGHGGGQATALTGLHGPCHRNERTTLTRPELIFYY